MERRTFIVLMSIVALAIGAAGCAGQEEQTTPTSTSPTVRPEDTATPMPPTVTPLAQPQFLLARVESLEVISAEDIADGNTVRLRGTLSNSCSRVGDVVTELEQSVFTIAVLEVQEPPDQGQECIAQEIPFDTTVDLPQVAAGSYSVSAHGLQGSFTVADFSASAQEQSTPIPTRVTGGISGVVWHDLCEGTGSVEEELLSGCVADAQGTAQGDGRLADEPGIPDVRIGIASGDCASPATEFAISDADGVFNFNDLPAGPYCVSIDSQEGQNAEILGEGLWTMPAGQAQQEVVIEDEAGVQGVDFGWDFEFLPLAAFDPGTCTNSFAYLEDLNIPDDTELAPNQAFTKHWLLRNNGTCPWTDAYSIVFVGGDQLSAPDDLPLPQIIAPGQAVEIAINMIAPSEAGTYRGNWQIADSSGEPFGINGVIEDAFWLRIVVTESAPPQATPADGTGTIGGVVWDDSCLNSDPGPGCVEFPEGSGVYIADGTFGPLENGLTEITISLASQACPSDGSLPPAERVLATVKTTEEGQYRFEGLESGMYCIFMDALSDENVDFLIPGNWTWPATGVGRYTFFLDPGELALDLDFGWDFAD